MIYLVICLLCLIGIEVFIALPVLRYINALTAVSKKAVRVTTSSKISDHWKEIVLQRYARDMAVNSIVAFSWLMIALISIAFLILSCDLLLKPKPSLAFYLSTLEGMVVICVISISYYWVKKKIANARV